MTKKEIKETDAALWAAWTTKGYHEQFDIIDIERDSQNGDDIHIHLKDRDGYDYKGIITGTEISVAAKEEEIYCFCGYERGDTSEEGLDDWNTHIKECPTYRYKMEE